MTELSSLMEIVRQCNVVQDEDGTNIFADPQGRTCPWTEVGAVLVEAYWDRYGKGFSDDAYKW